MASISGIATARARRGFAKRMSDHIAYALVVYTLMLIFVVSPTMESEGTSIFPYFMLVLLVALAIFPCRNLDHRWQRLDESHPDGAGLTGKYWTEKVSLWAAAIGMPLLLALAIGAISAG